MKKHLKFLKACIISMIFFGFFIPIISSAQPQHKPGSGNGITLTETGKLSTSPYINAGSGFDFGTNPFTVESWVKRDSIKTTLRNYGRTTIQGTASNSWGIGFLNNSTLFFTRLM